jgi:hypothetical protein
MKRTGTAAALALLLAVGCSSDGGEAPSASSVVPNDMPACEEIYVDGAEITNENFGLACVYQGEDLLSPRPVRLDCSDGSTLVYNDLAWGYQGQPMTLTPEDDPSKMPEAEVDECLAPNADGTPVDPTGEAAAETDPG